MKILLAFLMLLAARAEAQQGTVVITIQGIDTKKSGDLTAAIFTEGNFPIAGRHLMGTEAAVTSDSMELIIKNVPAGDYGIAVFQDIDRDKKLKTNFVGMPQEPIGFSNDARIRFGPPSFEDARITVSNVGKTMVSITLR